MERSGAVGSRNDYKANGDFSGCETYLNHILRSCTVTTLTTVIYA